MRIAVDARSAIGQHPRGEGKTLLQLYAEIARQRPDWEFRFFGQAAAPGAADAGDAALRAAVPAAQVGRFDLPGFRWNSWENIGLPLQALRRRVDLLHGFSSGTPRWCPVPTVMTVHDVIPLLVDDGQDDAERERFRRRLEAGLHAARRIVTVSAHTRSDILRLYPGADASKFSVVHWGAPAADRAAIAQQKARAQGASAPGHVLAFGGGGARRKNVPGVVRMFRRVVEARPDARLLLVGVTHAGERAAVAGLIEQLGLARQVEVAGFVSEAALAQAYRDAACLVYLSTYEGFGLPPLEAMARGVPVVASNTSSIPEVVGSAALQVDPTDDAAAARAVLALLDNRVQRAEMIDLGEKRLAHFDWQRSAAAMIEILQETARPTRWKSP